MKPKKLKKTEGKQNLNKKYSLKEMKKFDKRQNNLEGHIAITKFVKNRKCLSDPVHVHKAIIQSIEGQRYKS